MIVYTVLQAATNVANNNKALNVQALGTMGVATGGSAALTPIFSAMGQAIKQHPKIKNDWLRVILPILALSISGIILLLEVHFGYTVDPLTCFLFIGMFLTASVGADIAYNAQKNLGVLPPGPDNHPIDAQNASSQTITIQTPTTTAVTSTLTGAGAVITPSVAQQPTAPAPPPANALPPSPFAPKT